MIIKNGQITDVFFGCNEEYWGITIEISFDGCSTSHNISLLYQPEKIVEFFEMLEIDDYDKIKGSYVRVKTDGIKTHGIGHIVKDKWIEW